MITRITNDYCGFFFVLKIYFLPEHAKDNCTILVACTGSNVFDQVYTGLWDQACTVPGIRWEEGEEQPTSSWELPLSLSPLVTPLFYLSDIGYFHHSLLQVKRLQKYISFLVFCFPSLSSIVDDFLDDMTIGKTLFFITCEFLNFRSIMVTNSLVSNVFFSFECYDWTLYHSRSFLDYLHSTFYFLPFLRR